MPSATRDASSKRGTELKYGGRLPSTPSLAGIIPKSRPLDGVVVPELW